MVKTLETLSNPVYGRGMTRTNGAAIRAIRQRSGLSIPALVALMAINGDTIHPDSLSNIERGHRNASDATAEAIAKALKVPVVAILAEQVAA